VKVIYSPRSRRDLRRILDFIIAESASQHVAQNYIARLLKDCDSLAVLPERYPPYRYALSWRMMPFENYLIFYKIKAQEVQIGHIRRAARQSFSGK
jgi:plasmid stabilization system protein ParE